MESTFVFVIQFTEIIFVDHQTGSNVYFKRRADQPITAALNYGNAAGTYGLWDGVGTNNAYLYQLLICDQPFFSGFLVSGTRVTVTSSAPSGVRIMFHLTSARLPQVLRAWLSTATAPAPTARGL